MSVARFLQSAAALTVTHFGLGLLAAKRLELIMCMVYPCIAEVADIGYLQVTLHICM